MSGGCCARTATSRSARRAPAVSARGAARGCKDTVSRQSGRVRCNTRRVSARAGVSRAVCPCTRLRRDGFERRSVRSRAAGGVMGANFGSSTAGRRESGKPPASGRSRARRRPEQQRRRASAAMADVQAGGASLGARSSSAMPTCAGRSPGEAQATGSLGAPGSCHAAEGAVPKEPGSASTPQWSCSCPACPPATTAGWAARTLPHADSGPLERDSASAEGRGAPSCSNSPCSAQMRCATSAKCKAGSTCPMPSNANSAIDATAARSETGERGHAGPHDHAGPHSPTADRRRSVCT